MAALCDDCGHPLPNSVPVDYCTHCGTVPEKRRRQLEAPAPARYVVLSDVLVDDPADRDVLSEVREVARHANPTAAKHHAKQIAWRGSKIIATMVCDSQTPSDHGVPQGRMIAMFEGRA